MTDRLTRDDFLAAFAETERRAGAAGPGWLREARRAAIARFGELGLPTTRDEDWKYTSLAPVWSAGLDLLDESDGADRGGDLPDEALAPLRVGEPAWSRLVFVDGRYSAKLSSLGPVPAGVRLGSLADAVAADGEWLEGHLAAGVPADALAALNAAFWRDGAVLTVPARAVVPEPIHVLHVATGLGCRASHPRSVIALGRGSRATVVETHVAAGGGVYLTNATTDIALDAGAELDHVKVTLESPAAFHVGHTRVAQAADSRFTSCAATFGGRLVRHAVSTALGAERAGVTLNGLFVIGGRQHVDTHTLVDHASGRATSRQLYKGVLDGRSRGVFNGRVVVRAGANGTDAHQANKNLLLSDEVEVDSKPALEIFADDVKCSHGAADGQLAPEAIFYLKSRGLDEAAARTLLTEGFANEVLERVRIAPVREWLGTVLSARLRAGRVVEPPEAMPQERVETR